MTLEAGAMVGGRYVVEREVASGGMGTVYAVLNRDDGRAYALKVIKQKATSGKATLERFRREAQLLSAFDHPGVVKMVDAGLMDDGSAFMVMELLEGETLLDYLRREAPVAPSALLPFVEGMAIALDAVHQEGVIHRDLKPSNVFLTPDGVKLVDFGVARGLDLVRLTITGQVLGTVRYMSPEQLEGRTELDRRADVYAMGLLVWAALAGGPPHGGTVAKATMSIIAGTPRLDEHSPVSKEIADVVHQAIAVSRDDRFTSAGAFANAFSQAVTSDESGDYPRTPTGFVPLPPTRSGLSLPAATEEPPTVSLAPAKSGAMKWLAAALLLVLVGVGAVAIWMLSAVEDPDPPLPHAPVAVQPVPLAPNVALESTVIVIESFPTGALVERDLEVVGNTPLELPRPGPGDLVSLRLSAAHYHPATVTFGADTPSTVSVELEVRHDPAAEERPRMGRRRHRSSPDLADPFPDGAPAGSPGLAPRMAQDQSGQLVLDPWGN